MEASSRRIVRASEIGQYLYCHRAWWLHMVQGVPLANVQELAAGTAGHEAHGRRVALAFSLQRAALVVLGLALLAAALWLLVR